MYKFKEGDEVIILKDSTHLSPSSNIIGRICEIQGITTLTASGTDNTTVYYRLSIYDKVQNKFSSHYLEESRLKNINKIKLKKLLKE